MHVPFLDLRVLDPEMKSEMINSISAVLDHGRILLGPEVDKFESQLAAYCGVRHAVGVASGTDALVLGLKALGVSPGDEVITSCLSFVGTANGIAMTGATPVFCDVTEDLLLDPQRLDGLITPRTKVVLPVHFTGRLADITAIDDICRRHGLVLAEDAAPAIGATYMGKRAGSFGKVGCLSINPMKVLNALGEAGAVLTDDDEVRDRLLALRYNGLINREYCHFRSINGRIDTLQAAVLLPRMKRLESIIARRNEIAARYDAEFSKIVVTPSRRSGYRDVYYTYTILTTRRDNLAAFLNERGIETKIQHPQIIPQHPAYCESDLGRYPVATKLTKEILCIPCHEKMDNMQVDYVVRSVLSFFAH